MLRRVLLTAIIAATCISVLAQPRENTRIPDPNLFVADPFVLVDGADYYLYGTSSRDGIVAWHSTDLENWDGPCGATEGLALHKNDSWGNRGFWAPEVYKIGDRYLMTYSVEEHVAVAWSDSPRGPFVQTEKKPLLEEKGIDSHILIQDDGTPRLYWVRFTGGNVIYTAPMSKDFESVDTTAIRHCITTLPGTWERTDSEPRANVAEGPFVLRKDGKYYLTYSCNHYQSPDYAVGWAVSDTPEGPWVRYEGNPILMNHGGYKGTGHHAFFTAASGELYIAYHAHCNAATISPRRTLISRCTWDPAPRLLHVEAESVEQVSITKVAANIKRVSSIEITEAPLD